VWVILVVGLQHSPFGITISPALRGIAAIQRVHAVPVIQAPHAVQMPPALKRPQATWLCHLEDHPPHAAVYQRHGTHHARLTHNIAVPASAQVRA
jgi:hypothetical protein